MRWIILLLMLVPSLSYAEERHYFAKVENGVVTQVIVADQAFINSGVVGDPSSWMETFDGQKGKRADVGDTFDPKLNCFVSPQPFDSWTFSETELKWKAPVEKPADYQVNSYYWDEETKSWRSRDAK